MYTNDVAASSGFFDFAEPNGFALVKVHADAKNPVGEGWQNLASRSRADWEQWRREGFNIGVHAGASRLITIDLDAKHGGIEAPRASLDSWCLARNLAPLPHHVTTPSGGQHIYLRVPEGVDAMALASDLRGTIGKGVDVLTGDRQSVAPGSTINGAAYTFNAAPFHSAPQSLIDFCTRVRPAETASIDKPGQYHKPDVAGLVDFLNENGEFEEYGDWLTCGMAMRAEFGDGGLDLWARSHDSTVTPDVIASKWKSFATEAKPGAVTLASLMSRAHQLGWKGTLQQADMLKGCAAFAAADASKASTIASPPVVPVRLSRRGGDWIKSFKPFSYLVKGFLVKGFCYSMTSRTGAGKTAIAILLTFCIALGEEFAGRRVKKGRVLYLAGENAEDVQARFIGACHERKLDPGSLDFHVIPASLDIAHHIEQVKKECDEIKPILIVVDTLAAYFRGDDENNNTEMVEYARLLRGLCATESRPTVLILAHPTKGAKALEEMMPRGGGSFLNEMDGNAGTVRNDDGLTVVAKVGKFRGPEFAPMYFGTHVVRDCPALVDPDDGEPVPTVVAHAVSDTGAVARAAERESNDIRMMRDIDKHPDDSLRVRAERLGISHHATVSDRIKKLVERKWIENGLAGARLTAKGQKELNVLDRQKPLSVGTDNVVSFPVPGGS